MVAVLALGIAEAAQNLPTKGTTSFGGTHYFENVRTSALDSTL
jgi:hypothetical protein